jgi:hypothetical protein
MRNVVAKFFRKEALMEMIQDNVPKRDLVQKKSGEVINSPSSIRRLYLFLKAKYKKARAGMSTVTWAEARKQGLIKYSKPSNKQRTSKPQGEDRIIMIQKPLDFILQHCPVKERPDGSFEVHPVYASAQRAAKYGRGDLVKKMAAQFLPA